MRDLDTMRFAGAHIEPSEIDDVDIFLEHDRHRVELSLRVLAQCSVRLGVG